jgi:FMN phosphatase YigB (HAD superfamily)
MPCASFDVFDTCLVRAVAAPSEVFRQLGRAVAHHLRTEAPEEFARQFIEWRTEAERRARTRSLREEITLAEIWQELVPLAGPAVPAGIDGPTWELDAEFSVLRGIASTRDRVAAERARGRRILFISDTYLPAGFLRRCLAVHRFAVPGDVLYASSETGLTKRTGNLFRHVIATEHLDPAGLHHLGDDAHSDVAVPRQLGINAALFSDARPGRIEDLLLTQPFQPSTRWIDAAGALRLARLTTPPEPSGASVTAGALVQEFLGPLLCVLGQWTLARAAHDRVGRLYFAARDARLLWSVCQRLSAAGASPVDCRYLQVSRQAVLLPSATEISPDGMPWLRRVFEIASLPRLLAKLELAPEHFLPLWQHEFPGWRAEDTLATRAHWDAFWALLQRPELTERIRQTIQTRRASAMAYFERIGLLDPVAAGFVDLGWFLTCQAALNQLCAGHRRDHPVHGYFLALLRGRLGPAEAGPATAVFYQEAPDRPVPLQHRWISRNHLLEHVAGIADHGSVRTYSADGQPVFAPPPRAAQIEWFHAVESAVLRYTEQSGAAWAPIGQDPALAADFLSSLLDEFFANPSPLTVRGLGHLEIGSDQNQLDTGALALPFTWTETLGAWLPHRLARSLGPSVTRGRCWPEASAVATPRGRRIIHRRAAVAQRIYAQLGWD